MLSTYIEETLEEVILQIYTFVTKASISDNREIGIMLQIHASPTITCVRGTLLYLSHTYNYTRVYDQNQNSVMTLCH